MRSTTRAYKQEDGVHYHARDMAVVRARDRQDPDRARVGDALGRDRGQRAARPLSPARICRERFGGQHLPSIEPIDLTREGPPRGRFIAPRLAEAVKTALERGEQALLFLNRRGYAPLTLVPRLRLPPRLPELRRLAGRSSLPAPAGLPSLRLLDAARRSSARSARRRTRSSPAVPASSGWRRRRPSCFPASASSCSPAI